MGLKEVLNSAEDERDEDIVVAGEDNQKIDLFVNVENRRTKHVIEVRDDELLDHVESELEEDDSVDEYQVDGDEVTIYSGGN